MTLISKLMEHHFIWDVAYSLICHMIMNPSLSVTKQTVSSSTANGQIAELEANYLTSHAGTKTKK